MTENVNFLYENHTTHFLEMWQIVLHTHQFVLHKVCRTAHYFRPWFKLEISCFKA